MRFRVRRANIGAQRRELFELCGPESVSFALGLGQLSGSGTHPTALLQTVVLQQQDAMNWLREKRDEQECHTTRIEFVEWAILIFVGSELLIDLLRLVGAVKH
jgi:hypothetical protein